VAIADAQVGPLPLSDVKRKWEAGEIGPDSLVWRPGMGDWAALSTVGDLASALAPVPQPSRTRPAAGERSSSASRGAAASAAAPVAPREEPTWKPAAASALAALATEEIASRGPEARPAAAPRNTAKSLVEQMNLPDAGGVDPTGAIPLPIKGMEPSPGPQAKRRTSVARGAAEVRHRRSVLRGVVVGAIAVILLAGGGAAAMLWYTGKIGGSSESPASVASVQPAPAAAAPAAAAPAAPAPKASPPVAAAPAPQPAPPAPVAAAPAPERKAAPPPPAPKPEPVRVARADPAPRPARTERRVSRPEPEPVREVARAPEREPEPPPAPAPAPSRKKDSVLDFDGGGSDRALEEALGGTPSGRSVYVPPRPGSDLPDHLSASQINEAVLTQVDSLRRCVSEQKSRDADASGTLKMRWIIQGDGAVRDVKCLTPEFASGPFAQCISGVVRTIRFPKSSTKGQEVTFPFTF
jgi:hypothetical protein